MESAIEKAQDQYEISVSWEPFFLRPNTPVEGVAKPPATAGNPRVGERLKTAGSAVGIDFTGKCDVLPNTALAHVLMEYTKQVSSLAKHNQMAEILFKGYFTDGDPPFLDKLLEYAESIGLDRDATKTYLMNPENRKSVYDKATAWSVKGVSGVPDFRMNGQKVFSGAQDEQAFLRMFEIIAEKFPLSSDNPSASM
uniref:Uncharacterized protein LOC100375622 n=1 Tax=Saccoglossus kowalevskii TaxID=10224 RepID=A0ABM0GPX3_SACKO|nr:PREDICTED: uncharacterized protein LOC100375622 [Saccoglossus kowalevskii]